MTDDKRPESPSDFRYLTGSRFQKGNRLGRGRKQGSRNKTTLALQELLDGQAEAITYKAVELALAGDTTALRLCLERLLPVSRERKLVLTLPALTSPADTKAAMNAILSAVTDGSITPGEGQSVMSLIEVYARTAAAEELQERIANLERKLLDNGRKLKSA